MEVANLLAFTWLSALAIGAGARLWRGRQQMVYVCILVHWVFCGLPLLWDMVFDRPEYSFINFIRSSQSELANAIYLAYISLFPVILYVIGIPWRSTQNTGIENLTIGAGTPPHSPLGVPSLVLYLLLILPLVCALTSPMPWVYFTYGFVVDGSLRLNPDLAAHHPIVSLSCIIAITAATSLLATRNQIARRWLATLPWVFIAIFLMGKRSIVALYFALLSQRLWDLGLLRGGRLPIYAVGIVSLFAAFSITYQATVRSSSSENASNEARYENFRIDYGRDHTIRTAIYAELQGDRILSYRGQATLFDLTMYVPRAMWPQKPYPYAVYMTSYAMGIKPTLLRWGFTTSILDQAISDYGWFGMLTAPLLLGLLCRLADGNQTVLFRTLGYLACPLFLCLHFSAFMPLFLLWGVGSLWHQFRRHLTLRTSAMASTES